MRSFSRRSPVLALCIVVFLGACSSGDGAKDKAGAGGTKGKDPGAAAGPFDFAVTAAAVEPMATKAPNFPPDVAAAVKADLDAWLAGAVVGPLRTGMPPSGLDAVFTQPALVKVSAPGPERAALVEEGPPLHGSVHQDRAHAKLTVLTAPGGEAVLVTAQIDVAHTVSIDGPDVDVVRGGELVLVPDRGTWRIDAFDVVTKRDTRAK